MTKKERGSMSENLRDKMQLALKQTWRDRAMSVSFDVTWRAMTDAAWEVVAPELDRLRVENLRLKRQERGQTTAAQTAWRSADASRERADAAEAECAVLRERLAALVSALERTERNFRLAVNGKPVRDMAENLAENARALASVPEPSEPEVCGFKGCTSEKGHDEKPAADGGAGGQQTAGERP